MDGFTLVRDWLQYLSAMGRAEKTLHDYGYWASQFFIHTGFAPLERITERHITAFLARLGDRAPSKSVAVRALRSLFGFAFERGLTPENPAGRLRPKVPRKPKAVSYSEEELARYFYTAAMWSERRAWTLLLCFALGARRGELAHIEPEDVEADEVVLRVTKSKVERRVPLGPTAKAALEGLRPHYNGTVLGGIDPQTVTMWAHEVATRAGFVGAKRRCHTLRKSLAKYLSRRGTPVEVISEILGHSSIAITTDYLPAEEDEKHAAMGLV